MHNTEAQIRPSLKKFKQIVEKITLKALKQHDQFDKLIWKNKPSYHNRHHIEAVIKTAAVLWKQALLGNDPLCILQNLEIWNKQHKTNITPKEFGLIIRLVFACHDLGNISEIVTTANGMERIVYLHYYQSYEAEQRSIQIADFLIRRTGLPHDQKRKYIPLVTHLIEQTKFGYDKNYPTPLFAVFTRISDQIGNELHNKNDKKIHGLIQEKLRENPYYKMRPYSIINFTRIRMQILIPDETRQSTSWKRTAVLKIIDPHIPLDAEGLPFEITSVNKQILRKKAIPIIKWPNQYWKALNLHPLSFAGNVLTTPSVFATLLPHKNIKRLSNFSSIRDPWCSGLTCHPVTVEIAGSNPVGSASWNKSFSKSKTRISKHEIIAKRRIPS